MSDFDRIRQLAGIKPKSKELIEAQNADAGGSFVDQVVAAKTKDELKKLLGSAKTKAEITMVLYRSGELKKGGKAKSAAELVKIGGKTK